MTASVREIIDASCRITGIALVVLASTLGAVAATDLSASNLSALFDRLDADEDGILTSAEITKEHHRLFERLLLFGDADGDGVLTRQEFETGLAPSRPAKPVESKQPAALPEAAAVRYLLLTLDADRNGVIELHETSGDLRRLFCALVERIDRDRDGSLDSVELSRGSRVLGIVARRYVESKNIDVDGELSKLEQAQGAAAYRFDGRRPLAMMVGNSRQARALFARFDSDGDGYLVLDEMPERLQPAFSRLLRIGDRDNDRRLSRHEFLAVAEQVSQLLSGNQ